MDVVVPFTPFYAPTPAHQQNKASYISDALKVKRFNTKSSPEARMKNMITITFLSIHILNENLPPS